MVGGICSLTPRQQRHGALFIFIFFPQCERGSFRAGALQMAAVIGPANPTIKCELYGRLTLCVGGGGGVCYYLKQGELKIILC